MNWIKKYIDGIRVHRKLMISNFLIVIVPIIMFFIIGTIGWGLLRFGNPVAHRDWMMLMPSSMADASIQIGFERINKLLIRPSATVDDVRNVSAILEAQGIDFLIFDGAKLAYRTPGTDVGDIMSDVPEELKESTSQLKLDDSPRESSGAIQDTLIHLTQRVDNPQGVRWLQWDNDELIYMTGYPNRVFVVAKGSVPFLAKDLRPEEVNKHLIEIVFAAFIGIFVLLIIGTGVYSSHRMATHILKPLKDLQRASKRLKNHEPMQLLPVRSDDELGETVETFNDMQLALKSEQERRKTYEERKRQLIAGVCHDIGTPLTSVKGYAEGILDGVARTEEKREHYVHMIYDSALKIESLVAMLSEFSKLELGQVTYRPITVDINEFMAEYMATKQDWFTSQGATLTWNRSETDQHGVVPNVSIDTSQFSRVLDNVLSNSLKYKDDTPLVVTVYTTIQAEQGTVLITIQDNGIGIEPGEAEHIFDIFYRTDQARTNVEHGSGIGLAIVKQIVEDANGHIWAQSDGLHSGLVTYISLPLQQDT